MRHILSQGAFCFCYGLWYGVVLMEGECNEVAMEVGEGGICNGCQCDILAGLSLFSSFEV